MRRVIIGSIALVALIVAWRAGPRHEPVTADKRSREVSAGENAGTSTLEPKSPSSGNASADTYPLVASLNAENSTIAKDLDLLSQMFDAWRTNFPREGNPFGENSEITAALSGGNSLALVLIPRTHRAINANGELCDRWGTPFRFHQLSGERMEIQSAGPDRKFGTGDDAIWNPQ
jgi:hypothetical protein